MVVPTLIDDGAVLPPGHQLVQVNAELAAALMPLLLPPRFVVGGRRQAGETLRFVFGSAMRCEPSLNKGGAASIACHWCSLDRNAAFCRSRRRNRLLVRSGGGLRSSLPPPAALEKLCPRNGGGDDWEFGETSTAC